MKKKKMRCPFCKSILIKGEMQRYETLCDHVCDPNRNDYPLRETYICKCADANNSFWNDWGDFYSRTFRTGSRSTSAINSGARKSEKNFAIEDKLIKIPGGRLFINICTKIDCARYRFICKLNGYE